MKKVLLTLFLLSALLLMPFVSAGEEPVTWIEPEKPVIGDDIVFYCEAPGAVDVKFKICSEDACYQSPFLDVHRDGDVWYAEVDDATAGEWHYDVLIDYGNGSTATVSSEFTVVEEEHSVFPVFTVAGAIGAGALLIVSFWAWRRHNS